MIVETGTEDKALQVWAQCTANERCFNPDVSMKGESRFGKALADAYMYRRVDV